METINTERENRLLERGHGEIGMHLTAILKLIIGKCIETGILKDKHGRAYINLNLFMGIAVYGISV